MFLPILYSKSSTGKVLEWKIEVEFDKYRTHTGQQDGKIVMSEWSLCEGKNTNKANMTTGPEQARKEAQALWKKKIKSHGYWEDVNDIDKITFIEPMLAKKLKDHKKKVKYPVMVDRKYNGMRQTVSTQYGPRSRAGEEINTAPHICKALQNIYEKYPNLVLDGELYNHEYRYKLNELMSIVRTQKPTEEDLQKSKDIVLYYVYDGYGWDDITEETACATRRIMLGTLLRDIPEIIVVPFEWAANEEEVMKLYDSYIADGYEGAIVRMNAAYEHKRSINLLKVKPTDDDEFEILELLEGTGNWSGAAKMMILKFKGDTFRASVKGSYENAAKMLKEKDKWVGKIVTIFYNGLTGLGTPNYAQFDPDNCFKGDR